MLKVLNFKKKEPELIFYERNDENGPKLSDFIQVNLGNKSEGIKEVLSCAYGVKGCVGKKRTLYIYQTQTRVHIDEVENLGDFIEIEVCLRDNQTEDEGKEILINLSKYLDISNDDLIEVAYLDLL
uniref:CYTH domain-containing protein n=1 Tax=Meloidogyne javanica TaxID=6303 RepID=A0A915LPP9_MELJA